MSHGLPPAVRKEPRLIQVILQSENARLRAIASLLQSTVQAARGVVKGTESQRRFNAQFAEFCCSAMAGLADVRAALSSPSNPPLHGMAPEVTMSARPSARHISEHDLVKELAMYVSQEVRTLGVQYLQHIGSTAVSQRIQRNEQLLRRERHEEEKNQLLLSVGLTGKGGSAIGSAAAERSVNTKRRRHAQSEDQVDTVEGGAPRRRVRNSQSPLRVLGAPTDGGIPHSASGASEPTTASLSSSSPIPAGVTRSGLATHSAEESDQADGERRDRTALTTRVGGRGVVAQRAGIDTAVGSTLTEHAASVGGSRAPREPETLSSIPQLALRLQPWQSPQPYTHGIAVERVTVERAGSAPVPTTGAGAGPRPQQAASPSVDGVDHDEILGFLAPCRGGVTALDICGASTATEMLQLLERREAAIRSAVVRAKPARRTAAMNQRDAGDVARDDVASRRSGRQAVSPPSKPSPAPRAVSDAVNAPTPPADRAAPAPAVGASSGGGAKLPGRRMDFIPDGAAGAVGVWALGVPAPVMISLAHCGVSYVAPAAESE